MREIGFFQDGNMRVIVFFILLTMSFSFIVGCGQINSSNVINERFKYDDFDIVTNLHWTERWQYYTVTIENALSYPHDLEGIILSEFDGQYYYHPFQVASYAIGFINSYRQNEDTAYLNMAYTYVNKLREIGIREHGGIYIPYYMEFRFPGSNDVWIPPWFSGYAQGYALMAGCRLYEVTGDPSARFFADSVFTTMLWMDDSAEIWTSAIDSAGYYWIEEYPRHPFTGVFNGFLASTFSLHDYYLMTHNRRCATLFKACCTTIKHYFNQYRVNGGVSYYCLGYPLQSEQYHVLVTFQLQFLAAYTGDSTFQAFSDSLYSDYH